MTIEKLRHLIYSLLKRSERHTKTDMIYLTKGGFWLLLNQTISTLSGLILLIAFANLIPAETYGTYRYVLSILGILAIGTFSGLNTVAIKASAEKKEKLFLKLVYKKSYLSLVSSLFGVMVAIYYHLNGNSILTISFIIAAIGLPLAYTFGMYESLLLGRKNFKGVAIFSSLNKVLVTISLVVTIFLTDNLLILLLIYFIPEIILQGSFLLYLYKTKPQSSTDQLDQDNRLFKFGWHLSLMDVLKIIASQIDKMLVFHYLGAGQLALYAIAITPSSQIKTVMQNLTTLALPKMNTAKAKDTASSLPGKIKRLEIFIIGLIIIYWLAAPLLFQTFFPKYIEAIFISQIYALSLLFFPRTFLSTAMTAHLKQKELYLIRFWAPIIRISIFLVALPLWGMWGAILGSIAGNFATTLIYQYYFKKAFAQNLVK